MSILKDFLGEIEGMVLKKEIQKISLGNYRGEDVNLKNIYIKPVLIKQDLMLSFVYRYQTKDITKNYSIHDAILELEKLVDFRGFRLLNAQKLNENLVFQMNKKGEWRLQKEVVANRKEQSLSHDKLKERKIGDYSKAYLHKLNLTDAEGKVFKNAQDKWKQINHYIELLSTSLKELPAKEKVKVVDMGAGKGYLTFALYDYIKNSLEKDVDVVGIEYRQDLVDFCNQVAKESGFDSLSFEEGSIEDYHPSEAIDVLIALHACDTATDDAIYKGIQNDAELIVVAPCCHKQVRRELEAVKAKNDLDFMTQYGIFLERHAEMLTDSIRALIMEYYGYEMRVMQFISDQHTPKNVMLVGSKRKTDPKKQAEISEKIKSLKAYFGINYQHLERLCGLDK